ncbi:MAG TPA: S8 family serine peptidase, partial [Chitinophagaceae bacterium]
MSKGLYKGIASEADLVLLKVQDDEGRITTENLVKALQWVLENHEFYNIRVVNMSVYDDCSVSYKASLVDQLAEELIGKGVVVVAAVGNKEDGEIKPPGNSLNVIAVGGIDDGNCIDGSATSLYHSTYGYTTDGLVKPELVANAIWIAAPILPGTKEKTEAEMLHRLLTLTDIQLQQAFEKNDVVLKEKINLDSILYSQPVAGLIRNAIKLRIRDTKYFHPDYMHVDGTSFAAPLVTAVIAQLLEVEPTLTPMQIRTILFSTAKPFHDLPIERQGFGYVQPRKAVMKAMKKGVVADLHCSPCINHLRNTIEFYIQHDWASQVALAGTFNKWSSDMLLLEHGRNGIWKIEIPMLPKGRYTYKFFVDENIWIEDVCNPFREPDGMNGWNSVLEVN